jgi:hypothetical protein
LGERSVTRLTLRSQPSAAAQPTSRPMTPTLHARPFATSPEPVTHAPLLCGSPLTAEVCATAPFAQAHGSADAHAAAAACRLPTSHARQGTLTAAARPCTALLASADTLTPRQSPLCPAAQHGARHGEDWSARSRMPRHVHRRPTTSGEHHGLLLRWLLHARVCGRCSLLGWWLLPLLQVSSCCFHSCCCFTPSWGTCCPLPSLLPWVCCPSCKAVAEHGQHSAGATTTAQQPPGQKASSRRRMQQDPTCCCH